MAIKSILWAINVRFFATAARMSFTRCRWRIPLQNLTTKEMTMKWNDIAALKFHQSTSSLILLLAQQKSPFTAFYELPHDHVLTNTWCSWILRLINIRFNIFCFCVSGYHEVDCVCRSFVPALSGFGCGHARPPARRRWPRPWSPSWRSSRRTRGIRSR